MDLVGGENESGDEHEQNSNSAARGKRSYHRHSSQQIQSLEEFFKDCPNPDEKQRNELSKNLGLEPKQVKFWFQNKRTQVKAQAERANNNILKSENEKIHYENLVMKTALENLLCLTCHLKKSEDVDRQTNLQNLRAENAWLKREYERVWNIVAPFMGKFSASVPPRLESVTSLPVETFPGQGMGIPSFIQEQMGSSAPFNLSSLYEAAGLMQGMEKTLMLETAATAMEEFLGLLRVNEPLWIKSPTEGRYFIHNEIYNNIYPKIDNSINSGSWIESSKESAIIPMPAANLIEIFSDSQKWMNIFPTIVTKARTIGTIDTGSLGGSLQLMYAKLHILSPLVEPREYIFLRYIRQLDSETWVIVDASYNCFNRIQDASLGSWKLPSGCKIQMMANGKSEVTWVEHVKVDGKSFNNLLFKDLTWSCQAFGAKRWLVTLERMCERFLFSVSSSRNIIINRVEAVAGANESRKCFMDLSHKMVKSFCEILSMPRRIEVGHQGNLNYNDLRIAIRENNVSGDPNVKIVCMTTSLWLPISCKNLFDFFKDEKTRSQWDLFFGETMFQETGHIATGAQPENCITLLKPVLPEESTTMTLLQESCFDPLGGLVIYASIFTDAIKIALRGEDISEIPVLPSGFVISGDGQAQPPNSEDGASTSSITNTPPIIVGSILTIVFQTLMANLPSQELSSETIENMNTLMSCTIAKVKEAVGCAIPN